MLRFCLLRSFQSNNGHSASQIAQFVMNFLRIRCLLHCSWRVQASGKVECTNQSLKYRGTQLNWRVVLPVSLLEAHESWHSAPDLSSLECFMSTFSFFFFSFLLLKRKKKLFIPVYPLSPSSIPNLSHPTPIHFSGRGKACP